MVIVQLVYFLLPVANSLTYLSNLVAGLNKLPVRRSASSFAVKGDEVDGGVSSVSVQRGLYFHRVNVFEGNFPSHQPLQVEDIGSIIQTHEE